MKYTLCALSLAAVLMAGGCGSEPHYPVAAMMTPHGEEPIMFADGDLANAVALAHDDGIMEKRTAGGALQVTLRFINVTNFPVTILVEAQFKEEDGSLIDGDKSSTPLVLEPGQTQSAMLLSKDRKAARYSVLVLKHNSGPRPTE